MSKSCLDCPSYLTKEQTPSHFTRSLGVPQCARYAHPLQSPKVNNARPELVLAATCDQHGQFRPTGPVNYDGLTVALPDPDHIEFTDADSTEYKFCDSCTKCQHYVPEGRASQELGFRAAFCKARGRLIPTNRSKIEAQGCAYRKFGMNAESTDKSVWLAAYDKYTPAFTPIDAFFVATDPVKDFEDPTSYETDKPVEAEHKEIGIRAWRRISDPEQATRYTYLPIFEPSSFSHDDQLLIPRAGDKEHPELYKDHMGLLYTVAVLWSELDETPTLWGEAGTGKTELARHMAWMMGLPFDRISITGSTELDDLVGTAEFEPGRGTFFREGRIPRGWRSRRVMLVDEPNTGRPEVWQFLRPLTDNSRQLVVNNDYIERDDNCYLMMAMNPAWDPRNRGVEDLADADVSRLAHISVELPPREVEETILAQRVAAEDGWQIDDQTLKTVMNVAEEARALSRDGSLSISWGLRPQIQVARALRWFKPARAYRITAADYLEPAQQAMILDLVKAHFGDD